MREKEREGKREINSAGKFIVKVHDHIVTEKEKQIEERRDDNSCSCTEKSILRIR